MNITLPKAINGEGTLGAFTPSDPVTPTRKTQIERGVRLLSSYGFNVKFAKHAFIQRGYISASPEERAADITQLASDGEIDALIATCGGKSSNALLHLLNYEVIFSSQKPIMGFSDVGVLLNAITAKTGLITFYGPNVLSKLHESDHSNLSSLKYVFNEDVRTCARSETINEGVIEGRLIGGNLSTFTISVAGTIYEPKYEKAILFWESGSRDWRLIDQYISALQIRGVLDRIHGMLIGKIGEDDDLSEDENWLLKYLLRDFTKPILRLPMFGHGKTENPLWPIGGLARLDATNKTVTLLEPIVAY